MQNFSYKNLQGYSFKNQDLTGLDFSHADIRGSDFTKAVLIGANFRHVKAGLQTYRAVLTMSIVFFLMMLLGVIAGLGGLFTISFLKATLIKRYVAPIIIIPIILGIAFIFTVHKSYKLAREVTRLAGKNESQDSAIAVPASLLLAILGTLALIISVIFSITGYFAVVIALIISGIWLLTIAFLLALAMAGIVDIAGPIAVVVSLIGFVAVAGATTRVLVVNRVLTLPSSVVVVIISSICIALLSLYISLLALNGKYRFTWLRMIAINFAAVGGTSFRGADLTDVDFTDAILQNTDFRKAILKHTRWTHARKLNQARLDGTALFNESVRDLLITRMGRGKFYINLDLKETNLEYVDLSHANMRKADLSQAILRGANLEGANLAYVVATNTNFTNARMTGACLENWVIDRKTNLKHVDCEFVYLRQDPIPGTENRERRPIKDEFNPGEFTEIFQTVLDTVEIIFRNGLDWRSLRFSIEKLQVEYETTELSIQGIERKGDGIIVVKVAIPPDLDTREVHDRITETYEEASKFITASASSKVLSSSLGEYVDSVIIDGLNHLSVVYEQALIQKDYIRATEIANSAYEMCQNIVESLDPINERDIYLRVVALSSYWKLNRELYRGLI